MLARAVAKSLITLCLLAIAQSARPDETPVFVVQSQGIGMLENVGLFSLMVVTAEGGIYHRQLTFGLDDPVTISDAGAYTRPLACDARAFSFLSNDGLDDLLRAAPSDRVPRDVVDEKVRMVRRAGSAPAYIVRHVGAEVSGITCIYSVKPAEVPGFYHYQLIENQADLEIRIADDLLQREVRSWLREIEYGRLIEAAHGMGFLTFEELQRRLAGEP